MDIISNRPVVDRNILNAWKADLADKDSAEDEAIILFNSDLAALLNVFNDVDQVWLSKELQLYGDQPDRLEKMSSYLLENPNYPKFKDVVETVTREDMENLTYTFEDFLDKYPNPFEYFYDENAIKKITNKENYMAHCRWYVMKKFPSIAASVIDFNCRKIGFYSGAYNVIKLFEQEKFGLSKKRGENCRRCVRPLRYYLGNTRPVHRYFYDELWFKDHEDELREYMSSKEEEKRNKIELARLNGELLTCQICFDDEMLFEESLACPEGHLFCRQCVKKFPCLSSDICSSYLTTATLQKVLKQATLDKILNKMFEDDVQQLQDEVDREQDYLEELVTCPFCSYAVFITDGGMNKVLKCGNPDCMRESCRLCREPSHIPYGCYEAEQKTEVAARTAIENEMTDAMVRTCYRCKKSPDNLKTMGVIMVKLRNAEAPGQQRRRWHGMTPHFRSGCPLWVNNKELHEKEVKDVAEKAKINALRSNCSTNEAVKVLWSHHAEGKNGKSNNYWKDCREKRSRSTRNNIRELFVLLVEYHHISTLKIVFFGGRWSPMSRKEKTRERRRQKAI
ncbi:hypothetical protein HELRODRAFT_167602 [Helobdella robusta]|uniref:RING-type domain-containing protein n=1 Tax=Helobdella robusta TaxID=6412 RepID=T1EZJ3_HELRO|nr:hypothetical protein HELRODRAFT_167602 [Helobdella robusta]ESO11070.1 hypothetical protein HELRODRAFT_167602 [Helobdella robusta]